MQPVRHTPALDPDLADGRPLPAQNDSSDTRDTLRAVMPWVVSFLGHLAVMILAALAVGVAVTGLAPTTPPPVADWVADPDPDPRFNSGIKLTDDATSTRGQPSGPEAEVPLPEMPQVQVPQPVLTGQGVTKTQLPAFVSQVPTTVARQGGGAGAIFGDVGNNGTGDHGLGGGGGQPIRKIVFLVDASGSLVDTLPFVIDDLGRMLDSRLQGDKQFNIIFFSGKSLNQSAGSANGLAALFPSRLESASAANRKKATDWIQRVEAGGSGDALAAIKKALEMDPDQIHLLSDNITGSGVWEMHQDRFISEMKRAYDKAVVRRQGVRGDFKTYQFVYADPLEQIGRQPTLRRLVEETGGLASNYKFVTARSLGLR